MATSPQLISPTTPGAGAPPTPAAWEQTFEAGLRYGDFLERHGTPEQRSRWQGVYDRVVLTSDERRILAHFAAATSAIDLKFLDRDARPDIAAHLKVCGGQRVPTLAFFSEDFTPVLIYGERTLSAYRAAAASQLGGTCQTGIVPPAADALAAVTGDWLREFERVQLILRLSGRLRQLHGD